MSGTRIGGIKTAQTNKLKYDELYPEGGFYKHIGKLGGQKSKGGFAKNPELAREAGRRGGQNSWKNRQPKGDSDE